MALSVSLSVGSKTPSHSIEGQVGEVDSLAPFQGVNAIPCPLGMDIEFGPNEILHYPQITGFFSLCDKDKPNILYNAPVTPLYHLKKF